MKAKKHIAILEPGDIVDLIAPGFRCDPQDLKNGIKLLKSWGLKPRVPQPLWGPDVICSNSMDVRQKHLWQALTAHDSKVIWCIRGGYGSLPLLEELSKKKPPHRHKWIVGYSDITSLQSFVRTKWGWPSLHASLVDGLGSGKSSSQSTKKLYRFLFENSEEVRFSRLKALNGLARKSKKIKGQVVGGNLSVIQSALGTPFQENNKGQFLFLEDIGERGYRVDKMLTQLKLSGALKGVKAILLGDFTGGYESNGKSLVGPVLKNWAQQLACPVIAGLPCGHGSKQDPLPLGTKAVIELGEHPQLIVKGTSTK